MAETHPEALRWIQGEGETGVTLPPTLVQPEA